MIAMLIVIFILLCIFVIGVILYNKIIESKVKVGRAESTIDVYLMQRFNLIPNLVECVRAYTEYENDILINITKLREEYLVEQEKEKGNILDEDVNGLLGRIENYPDLKASEQFLNLQKNLIKLEDQIQAARRIYNMEVANYNTVILTFPTVMVSKIFGFKTELMFDFKE